VKFLQKVFLAKFVTCFMLSKLSSKFTQVIKKSDQQMF